jgi:hypothetical protein
MADYKNIKGFNIQYLDSDPPNPIEGQMWFNSTSQTLKGAEAATIVNATWASGADMNVAKAELSSSKSDTDQTVTVAKGANAETYNSISWTTITAPPTASNAAAGFGTKDDFTKAGGIYSTPPGYNVTVNWNGSAWTAGGNINWGRYDVAAFGLTGSSGIAAGGTNPAGPVGSETNKTESYNGVSWSEVATMNTGSRTYNGAGVQTDGISATRGEMSPNAYCEIWNGTSWTETTDLNTPRSRGDMSGLSSTSALCFGGLTTVNIASNEYWNGTSWTELNDLATAKHSGAGSGSSSSALMVGGDNGTSPVASTEEWSIPEFLVKTFTTS